MDGSRPRVTTRRFVCQSLSLKCSMRQAVQPFLLRICTRRRLEVSGEYPGAPGLSREASQPHQIRNSPYAFGEALPPKIAKNVFGEPRQRSKSGARRSALGVPTAFLDKRIVSLTTHF